MSSDGAWSEPRLSGGPQSAGRPHSFALLGRVALGLGLLLLLIFSADFGYGLLQEQQLNHSWQTQAAAIAPSLNQTGTGAGPALAAGPGVDPRPVDGVDFAIRVPRIGYFAAVQEGTDALVLASGPGHYPSTPWPGQIGNVGVAAHNVYWIQFNDLQLGDEVVLQTRWGTYTYKVTGKQIVNPDNRQVLAATTDDKLTLTTCWPLWAGAFASQRLIISADQVSPAPHSVTVRS